MEPSKQELLRLAIVQFNASPVPNENLAEISHWASLAAHNGANLAVFPEFCTCLGGLSATRRSAFEPSDAIRVLGNIARTSGIPCVFGGITISEGSLFRNRTLVFDATGHLQASYDKQRLFPARQRHEDDMCETALYTPGTTPCTFTLFGWRIALLTCFDIRFPELSYACTGCDLLLCPAAFTRSTGRQHWAALLKARAIELQAWTAGIDQCGENRQTGLPLFGGSLLFTPAGELPTLHILQRNGTPFPSPEDYHDSPALLLANLSYEHIEKIRALLPMRPG
ncbi:MAG: hypothetical protein IJJ26_07040 [Victivallales bacterium]|nr:hypothetical protein [Victivallales bacterium]